MKNTLFITKSSHPVEGRWNGEFYTDIQYSIQSPNILYFSGNKVEHGFSFHTITDPNELALIEDRYKKTRPKYLFFGPPTQYIPRGTIYFYKKTIPERFTTTAWTIVTSQ